MHWCNPSGMKAHLNSGPLNNWGLEFVFSWTLMWAICDVKAKRIKFWNKCWKWCREQCIVGRSMWKTMHVGKKKITGTFLPQMSSSNDPVTIMQFTIKGENNCCPLQVPQEASSLPSSQSFFLSHRTSCRRQRPLPQRHSFLSQPGGNETEQWQKYIRETSVLQSWWILAPVSILLAWITLIKPLLSEMGWTSATSFITIK